MRAGRALTMQWIGQVAVLVRDYDEAIEFYVERLGFVLLEDRLLPFRAYQARGVVFVRPPREEPYGTVAVFADLYGNRWDLLQPK
jgi:predicted enzyme related to lactoylglutathione lyase